MVLYLIDLFPESFYLYVFISVITIQLIMVVLFPILIQPLFNKFEPLDEGSLKKRIVDLAKEIGFKPSKILKMDGSKRSHHSNAYFIGLFKEKRIVLFDTLLNQTTENEVLSILCHEFGHWYYNHTWMNIIFSFSIIFGYLYTFNIFVKNKIFMSKYPMILKLNYFMLLTVVINPLLTLIQNYITRIYERQADRFAVKKGYGNDLKTGLIKIHIENKSNICPDSWYSTYHHSHPTLSERIELIDSEINKMNIKMK
jgi:STE24 endopeptidase